MKFQLYQNTLRQGFFLAISCIIFLQISAVGCRSTVDSETESSPIVEQEDFLDLLQRGITNLIRIEAPSNVFMEQPFQIVANRDDVDVSSARLCMIFTKDIGAGNSTTLETFNFRDADFSTRLFENTFNLVAPNNQTVLAVVVACIVNIDGEMARAGGLALITVNEETTSDFSGNEFDEWKALLQDEYNLEGFDGPDFSRIDWAQQERCVEPVPGAGKIFVSQSAGSSDSPGCGAIRNQACRTINYAIDSAPSGSVICVANGSYSGIYIYNERKTSFTLVTADDGNDDVVVNGMVLRAAERWAFKNLKFIGGGTAGHSVALGTTSNGGNTNPAHRSYMIAIMNSHIGSDDENGPPSTGTSTNWQGGLTNVNTRGVLIANNKIHHVTQAMTLAHEAALVIGNEVWWARNDVFKASASGPIWIVENTAHSLIKATSSHSDYIQGSASCSPQRGHRYLRNFFTKDGGYPSEYGSATQGFGRYPDGCPDACWHGLEIVGNILDMPIQNGIRFNCGIRDSLVLHNTLIGYYPDGTSRTEILIAGPRTNSLIQNNIATNFNIGQNPSQLIQNGNLVLPTRDSANGYFVDVDNHNLHLLSSSPAIDQGVFTASDNGIDLDGEPRLSGPYPDPGADEVQQ